MPSARHVTLIEVVVTEGKGVEPDPARRVVYLFRPDGTLVGRWDEWEQEERKA